MGDEVFSPLELSPANPTGEHLHSLPGVRRLHVPHHVPLGREQATTVIAFELASASGTTAPACVGLLCLAGECCLQHLGQPAPCLPPDRGSEIPWYWIRGNHHGEAVFWFRPGDSPASRRNAARRLRIKQKKRGYMNANGVLGFCTYLICQKICFWGVLPPPKKLVLVGD